MGDEDLCRLCAEVKPAETLVCIEDEEGIKQQLATKILKFFEVKIASTDRLPICVCSKCCERVKITSEFNDRIHEAQQALSMMLEAEFNADVKYTDMLIKVQTRSDSPEDFVECLLSDNETRNLAAQCTTESESLDKELETESDYDSISELKQKHPTDSSNKKKKPTRTKVSNLRKVCLQLYK